MMRGKVRRKCVCVGGEGALGDGTGRRCILSLLVKDHSEGGETSNETKQRQASKKEVTLSH